VGGVALSQISLFAASLTLFSYVFLSLFFAPQNHQSKLEVRRILKNRRIYEDETFETSVELRNSGPSKIEIAEIYDRVSSEILIESGSNHSTVTLLPHEAKSFTYSGRTLGQGEFTLGPTHVRIEDYQNVKFELKVFPTETKFAVLPKVTYVPKLRIRPKITKNWPGEIVSRKRGPGLEFYGISDYVQGDPVRRINWKVSSRFEDRLQSNQFLSELGGDGIILLDAREQSDVGRYPNSTLNYSIKAAALLSFRLLRDRNRVGMVIVGSSLTKIFPGFGRRQFDRLLLALSMTKPSGEWTIGSIGKYLSFFFSRAVQIVFISSLADYDSFAAVNDMVSRGYNVLVVSPSALDAERIAYKQTGLKLNKTADRLAQLERQNRLEALRKIATVVDWNLAIPFSEAMSQTLTMKRS
jgi:uncharacterized protein (DUF58 family)